MWDRVLGFTGAAVYPPLTPFVPEAMIACGGRPNELKEGVEE